MITADDIEENKPLVVKWDKPLVDGSTGEVTDGVMRGNANEFMTRIEDESELLSRFRYVEMNGETQDLQVLRVRARFQNMNKLSGAKKGAQIESLSEVTETVPDIVKEKLTAQPFTAFTVIPKTWLHTNIEKQGFIAKYESLLVPSCKFSAEQISVFGKKTESDADGIHALDGLLTQLDTINEAYEDNVSENPKFPMGKYTDIAVDGSKMITKGDNNKSNDEDMTIDHIVGKYIYKVPFLGAFLNIFRNPIYLTLILVIGILFSYLISTDKDGKPIVRKKQNRFDNWTW